MKKYKILIIVIIFFFHSCNSKRSIIKKELEMFLGYQVKYPNELVLYNKPTNIEVTLLRKSEYKLLIFIDSTYCNECKLKTYIPWNNSFDEFFQIGILPLFIINTSNAVEFISTIKTLDIKFPFFIDVNGVLKRDNAFLCKTKHRFFLLKNDTIIAVGDPLYNNKLKQYYLKISKNNIWQLK